MGLARVDAVGRGAVTDRGDADGSAVVREQVDHAVRADAQRSEAQEPPAELMARGRIAFQEPERLLHGVDQRPLETQQL